MPAEGRENPLLKKGNSDAFFREKYLTKNKRFDTCIIPWKGLFRVAALHFPSSFPICLGYILTASVTVDY